MISSEFPKEFYVDVGDETRLARLTVNKLSKEYSVELDLIFKESRKIWKHLEIMYKLESEEDAIHRGRERLSRILNKVGDS